MKKIFFVTIISVVLSGCSKMEEKKSAQTPPKENQSTDKNNHQSQSSTGSLSAEKPTTSDMQSSENKSSKQADEKAEELVKKADEAIAAYEKNKSENTKSEAVASCLAAGNYLMFDANLPAREKYRPALKYYRKVLSLDPKNAEAEKNKKQIEDIYTQMGMPIPQ